MKSWMGRIALSAVAAAAFAGSTALKADMSPVKVSGYAIGDYYWIAQSNTLGKSGMPGEGYSGQSGWDFRRIYISLDQNLDDAFSWETRLELDGGDFTGNNGGTSSTTLIQPYLKTAFLKWKYMDGEYAWFGLNVTPEFDFVEGQWGYRSVEKTPLDLQGWSISVDQGVGLMGSLGMPGLSYEAVVGNGTGQKALAGGLSGVNDPKTGVGKEFAASITYQPMDMLVAQVEGNYDNSVTDGGFANPDAYKYLLGAFVELKSDMGRLGLQYDQRDAVDGTPAQAGKNGAARQELVSAFLVGNILDNLSFYARMDQLLWEPNPTDGDNLFNLGTASQYIEQATGYYNTTAILGLDYKASANVHFEPNVEVVSYEAQKSGGAGANWGVPSQDVIPRLTMYVTY